MESIPRERVCQLAGVERGRHRRWQEAGLLGKKDRYGEIDVIKAAALDELWRTLKPSGARMVWSQIVGDLGIPCPDLEVVVRPADYRAQIARSGEELAEVLPRGEPVIVVSLHGRIEQARERLRSFRSHVPTSAKATGDVALLPSTPPLGATSDG